jgi:hypothetical protein
LASHRIAGNEVGRSTTPGGGSIRIMGRSRKRKLSFWTVLFAPVVLIGGVVTAIVMWPFR